MKLCASTNPPLLAFYGVHLRKVRTSSATSSRATLWSPSQFTLHIAMRLSFQNQKRTGRRDGLRKMPRSCSHTCSHTSSLSVLALEAVSNAVLASYLEQTMLLANVVHRYEFALLYEGWQQERIEAFTQRPGPMPLKIWRGKVQKKS